MTNRYSRQILFPPIGKKGQRKIGSARLLLVGCGALGSVSAEMLVRAGVGFLRIVDRDFVEESNLQRQSLFEEEHAREGLPKAVAAREVLRRFNSKVEVEAEVADLHADNVERLASGVDLVVDGTDNFETRYLLNDYSVRQSLPWVFGACLGSYGTARFIHPPRTPCLRCLFPQMPQPGSSPTCETAGIIAPVVHMVASYQVAQCLKYLTGAPDWSPKLLHLDVWQDHFGLTEVGSPRPDCPCCGLKRFEFLQGPAASRTVRLCGRNAVQVCPSSLQQLDFARLASRLRKAGKVRFNEYMMRIHVPGYELAVFRDGRSIIRGTEDVALARALYARYVGC